MSLPAKKSREIVFQLLFSLDMGDAFEEELIPFLMAELCVTKKLVREAFQLAKSIWEKREELDSKISAISQEYALDRIGKAERNILRQGLFDLIYSLEIPAEVVFSESVRLTRKFSTPEAASFVNALLDRYVKDNRPHAPVSS